MNKKARRAMLSTAMLILVLNTGCGRSKNREVAQGFVAQFDRILEQRKTLDKLEEQGKQYEQQLEKDLQEPNVTKQVKALSVWVGENRALLSQARSIGGEGGEEGNLMVCFRCPFCLEPSQVSLAGGGPWPIVVCEPTTRRCRVRFDVPTMPAGA